MNTALIFASSVAGTNPGNAPVANFSVSDNNPPIGETLQFTDQSTNKPTSWQWLVNGVTFSTSQNPTFYCSSVGFLSFLLIATNQFGTGTHTQQIYVQP